MNEHICTIEAINDRIIKCESVITESGPAMKLIFADGVVSSLLYPSDARLMAQNILMFFADKDCDAPNEMLRAIKKRTDYFANEVYVGNIGVISSNEGRLIELNAINDFISLLIEHTSVQIPCVLAGYILSEIDRVKSYIEEIS